MKKRRSTKSARPKLIGVIASPADLRFALAMRTPPDLFELRLDCLAGMLDRVERKIDNLRAPLIITARDPREGGANNLSFATRRTLLLHFLPYAKYLDVELRSARAFEPLLNRARKKNVRVILSFHDFESTPSARTLRTKAAAAKKNGADIFKVACRTDSLGGLARLADFVSAKDVDLPASAMGIGKFGSMSRMVLARLGSALNYAALQQSHVEGQLPIELLRSALRR